MTSQQKKLDDIRKAAQQKKNEKRDKEIVANQEEWGEGGETFYNW